MTVHNLLMCSVITLSASSVITLGKSDCVDPGTFSENVLILGMARVRSGDLMFRSGFVSNPVNKTLICGDFLLNPSFIRPESS